MTLLVSPSCLSYLRSSFQQLVDREGCRGEAHPHQNSAPATTTERIVMPVRFPLS